MSHCRQGSTVSFHHRPFLSRPGPEGSQGGFSALKTQIPRAFRGFRCTVMQVQLCSLNTLTKVVCFAPCGPDTLICILAARHNEGQPRSGCLPHASLDGVSSLRLAASLGHIVKMPRLRFYNLCLVTCTRRGVASGALLQSPVTACLTARLPASALSAPNSLSRRWFELRCFFGFPRALLIRVLWSLFMPLCPAETAFHQGTCSRRAIARQCCLPLPRTGNLPPKEAVSGLFRLLQMVILYEHDHRPLELPLFAMQSGEDRSSDKSRTGCVLSCDRVQPLRAFSEAPPPETLKVRGRTNRRSALPPTLARRPDFAPTAIAPDTSCRSAYPSSAWSGTTRKKCCLRRACLQRKPAKGSIAGSLSAKSWNMDRPEVPSVSEAFAMRTGGRPWPRLSSLFLRLFHHRMIVPGNASTLFWWLGELFERW